MVADHVQLGKRYLYCDAGQQFVPTTMQDWVPAIKLVGRALSRGSSNTSAAQVRRK